MERGIELGRPWWYDSYWEKGKTTRRRPGLPRSRAWVWIALVVAALLLTAASTRFIPVFLPWLVGFVRYFCRILALAIFVRVILSWFRISRYSWPIVLLDDLTNPVLSPLRRIIPSLGGFDFTPLIALVILYVFPLVFAGLVNLLF